MPKIPYKAEKGREDDEDYEIVSFEDFCDKPPGTKTDLLTLNDNINYRLHYESDKGSSFADGGETSTRDIGMHTETSLNGPKNASYKRKLSFAPFGRTDKSSRGPLFSGVIPKPRNEGESREHRYERFSPRRGCLSRTWEQLGNLFPGMVATALLCALCVGAWWAVGGALGGGWGDDHYRRLYERTHADDIKKPLSPIIDKTIPTENRYHDHNNLSTKNKNLTDLNFKKDNKKSEHTDGLADMQCENITDNMRFDCYPQSDASEENCAKRGCCWSTSTVPGAPYCFYPHGYETYRFVNSTENKHSLIAHYVRSRDTHYPGQFNNVRLNLKYLSDTVLYIKISDADNKRFEPPYPEIPVMGGGAPSPHYSVQLGGAGLGFRVQRSSDNVTLLDTQEAGALILSDKFLQFSAILPSEYIYGLGEKQGPLLNNLNWNTFTLFNRDLPPTENKNLYGSHPFFLTLEKSGKSHGVLLLNSNAMDIVLQPSPAITFRALGGVLQLYVLLGPTPAHVLQQLTELVGRPFMPPYWALGFHLSKFNYGSLNVTRDVMQKNIDAGIPLDAQWNDLDYMKSSNDFTYDPRQYAGLPQYVRALHRAGLHYVILVDPGQSASETPGTYPPFDRGLEMNVFVKNSTNQPFVGKVWNPKSTVWPDFTHPNASSYWKEMLANFHEVVPFDGAWIDMNEPSNFLSGSMYGECAPEELPYTPTAVPREGLRYKTLCMDARHYAGEHYDVHNLYAIAESIHTFNALREIRGRRPFVLSRASSPGSGRVAAHWGGDVYSKWHDLKMSVPALLSFSLFGIPMMGSDICGFIGNTTEDLCIRWSQLGAFYPFSRNHNTNDAMPQDPVSLGPRVVSAAREALRTRYRLLPYYYTLFWNAHVRGDTVARPLFFEFPNITKVYAIDEQFLLGPHVMVSAILQPGNSTTALFPKDSWYSLRDGQLLARDKWLEIGEENIVSVRAGAILPLQEPPSKGPVSTAITRSAPLQLLVVPGANGQAEGQLYWDDGDSINTYEEKKYSHIDFVVRNNELRNIIQWWGYGVPSINSISILGQKPLKSLTVNDVPTEFIYMGKTQVVIISGINLALDKTFSVKWTYKKSTKLFPNITKVYAIDEQFLLGPHVMVSAILQPGNSTTALFPKDSWYSLRDGQLLARDKWLEIGEENIVSVRAGAILPLQEPPSKGPVSTAITRSAPLQLLVVPGANGQAEGQLYWDDGDSINTYEEKKYSHIDFVVRNNELRNIIQWWGYGVPSINSISILGQKPLKSLTVNDVPTEFIYMGKTQVVIISGINLALDKTFSVKWTYKKSTKL